jgi:hypothetical protein
MIEETNDKTEILDLVTENSTQAPDIQKLNEAIAKASEVTDMIRIEMGQTIIGQTQMVDKLLIGLLANGHVLLEGVPGLAKTLAINSLSKTIDAQFSRIQFTPDLLPADVVGTMIYNPREESFKVKKGPIFANFVLADEINRAPAKVQSALLEAMQERQVTIGNETFEVPNPFLVLATQNPIDQEGPYPLPEAQIDRATDTKGEFICRWITESEACCNYKTNHRSSKASQEYLFRRKSREVHHRSSICNPLSRKRWARAFNRTDFVWCISTCKHRARHSSKSTCVYGSPWICNT